VGLQHTATNTQAHKGCHKLRAAQLTHHMVVVVLSGSWLGHSSCVCARIEPSAVQRENTRQHVTAHDST
jgi:hypothetical protein